MTQFSEFCLTLEMISKTTKRLEIQDILTNYFYKLLKDIKCDDEKKITIISTLYLITCTIYPEYYNKELGIGEALIIRIISDFTSRKLSVVKNEYRKCGDLSIVLEKLTSRLGQLNQNKNKDNELELNSVLRSLREISEITGKNSVEIKKKILIKLLLKANKLEEKYLIRIFETKLKIGLALKTVLMALGNAFFKKFKKEEEEISNIEINTIVKTAYNRLPNFELLVDNIMNHGIYNLLEYTNVLVGIPLKPMLAQPSKDINSVLQKMDKNIDDLEESDVEEKIKVSKKKNVEKLNEEIIDKDEGPTCRAEFKYDGERLQIHRLEEKVFLYSRNSENLIERYNELIPVILKQKCKNFILDCEVVAFNKEKEKIEDFQNLVTRKRKIDKEEIKKCQLDFFININKENTTKRVVSANICIFAFDILFCNEKSTIELPYEKRRKILIDEIEIFPNIFEIARGFDLDKDLNSKEGSLEDIFNLSLSVNCEGLILKKYGPSSLYLPSKRTFNWIKVKEDYLVGDTLDLLVIGAYYGKGKRKNFYGGFLLAAYNDEEECFESISKIGTGFSDEFLSEAFKGLKSTSNKPKNYATEVIPDIWIEPGVVWEVKAASLSTSNAYNCCKGMNNGKGISLRFPRFVKERKDKNIEDCTTISTIFLLYDKKVDE